MTTAYAIGRLKDRVFSLLNQSDVYEGMIVGINNKDNDLVVNVRRRNYQYVHRLKIQQQS